MVRISEVSASVRPTQELPLWFRCPRWCDTKMFAENDARDMQLRIRHGAEAASFSLFSMSYPQLQTAIADWWATLHQESPPNINEQ